MADSPTVPSSDGAPALVFHGNRLTLIDHGGNVWLTASDIAAALGYEHSDAVSRILRRNAAM